MNPIVRVIAWIFVAISVAWVAPRRLCAQLPKLEPAPAVASTESSPPSQQQVLVLRDGGVLTGQISLEGDRYLLSRGASQITLHAAQVMLVANSLENAYQQRRARMAGTNDDSHLALADWCLDQGLLASAELELAEARKRDARHNRLPSLERRLDLLKSRAPKQNVAQAVYDEPLSREPATNQAIDQTEVGAIVLTQAELPVSDLPPGAIELFTRRVQPILVNSCADAGCHETGGKQQFQLDRAILRGLSNRRTTMHNLTAALQLIDRDDPRSSPLLTMPRQTHGGMKRPVFGPRQEAAFRHLDDWVALVTNMGRESEDSSTQTIVDDPNAGQTNSEQQPRTPLTNPPGVGHAVYQESALRSAPDPLSSMQPIAPRVQFGASGRRWQPRDEFDPEIFNRRFAPSPAIPTESTAPATSVRSEEPSETPAVINELSAPTEQDVQPHVPTSSTSSTAR